MKFLKRVRWSREEKVVSDDSKRVEGNKVSENRVSTEDTSQKGQRIRTALPNGIRLLCSSWMGDGKSRDENIRKLLTISNTVSSL